MNAEDLDLQRCPWHDGEVAAQNRAGKFSQPPVIRNYLTEQLRDFFPQLSSIFAGVLDPEGYPRASHRGGVPGFVGISEQGQLTISDLAGNNYFNTLGNILLQPKCSLLFLDFKTGERIQLCGLASVDWTHAQSSAFFETPRRWVFTPAFLRRFVP